jgi:hypothetical protein
LDRGSERAKRKREHAKLMTDAQWQQHRAEREGERAAAVAAASAEVGCLSDREVLLLGAAIYWCEGSMAARLGVARERFLPTSLKRHKLGTNRRNVGDDYHGRVAVSVRRYRTLYWRIEGLVAAMLR